MNQAIMILILLLVPHSFVYAFIDPAAGSPAGTGSSRKATMAQQTRNGANGMSSETKRRFKEDELIVRFKPGIGKEQTAAIHTRKDSTVVRRYRKFRDLSVVKVSKGKKLNDALLEYRRDPAVLYAEPNYIYEAQTTPGDPSFTSLWGLHNTGQTGGTADADINAPEAWSITTGSPDTFVAVIDSGVDYTHQDLAANIWVNPGEIPGNGIDDDGNGYIDDVHGINAITNSGDPMDDAGHGTHVSGTIAAEGNNALGVVGVNWSAKVIACKFINSEGYGYTSDALECLDYLYNLKTRLINPVDIILSSNSWGGGYSQALRDAIDQQRLAGMLFVAAAGNYGMDTDSAPNYPSGFDLPNIISVAATDSTDSLAYFSNYGRRTVHVAAPGVDILSTLPTNTYGSYSGTSMATPHVSGLAALLKSQDPSRDWKAIKNLILAGGQDSPAANGTTVTGKRIRAADSNGVGSLTCSNQIVLSRMKPSPGIINTGAGQPVDLSVLNINCGAPIGSVVVSTSTGTTITLQDDGLGADQEAGDGIFSGQWTPPGVGAYTLTFPANDVVSVRVVPNYAPAEEAIYSYRPISGTQVVFATSPTATIASPFPIHFAGVSDGYPELRVSYYSGNLSFTDEGVYAWDNTPLPTSLQTQIAPYWDDLPLFYGGGIYWDVLGAAPNRELVVEYRNVYHYEYPVSPVTFQTVFFENSSDILFNYQDVTFGNSSYDAGASATVGVQVAPNLAQQFSYDTASLRDGMSLLWRVEGLSANAGPDRFVLPGAAVTLDGTKSRNSGGTITGYQWTQTAGTAVSLINANTPTPSFSAPGTNRTLTFKLTVTNDMNETASDTVNISVNLPPVAEAGSEQRIVANSLVTLNGTGSFDSDGTIQSYSWSQIAGMVVSLTGANAASPTFTAPAAAATLTFRLTVTDNNGQSSTDTVDITVLPPVSGATLAANLASPQVMGSHVTFMAGGSGGTGNYEYKFLVLKSGVTTTVQAYSSTNTWTWNTGAYVPAQYTITVSVRNVGSSASYEVRQTANYSLIETPAFGNITTIAGGGLGDGGPATKAIVYHPYGGALDPSGNMYLVGNQNTVRKVDAITGVISTIAGTGDAGYSGDGGPASAAKFRYPESVAVDHNGNIYISDTYNHCIRKIDAVSGLITTVAGNGTGGFAGNDGPAVSARLNHPMGIAIDANGNLFIADQYNHRIRMVEATTGIIRAVTGAGYGFSGDNGPATSASLKYPGDVAVDSDGNVFIADTENDRIRKVAKASGIITTVAGSGAPGFSGDTGPATAASLNGPSGVAIDVNGNILIADTWNSRVRRVDSLTGIITTSAGGANCYPAVCDGGLATEAEVDPIDIFVNAGDYYIADAENNRIRKVNGETGIITTIAGNGGSNHEWVGDGLKATATTLATPRDVSMDGAGNTYIADSDHYRIRKVDALTGTITTVAGNGMNGHSGDNGPAVDASMFVAGLFVDSPGNIFIVADNSIRKVDHVTGVITTVAGTGVSGFSGDNGKATSAKLYGPSSVVVDSAGNIFIADTYNYRVRKVDASSGIITTIAGNGHFGFSGDNGPAKNAGLSIPEGIALDPSGNLFIADFSNNRIRMVAHGSGKISTVAGNGTSGLEGDYGPATAAKLDHPRAVAVDVSGNILISDFWNYRIRMVDKATGVITSVIGSSCCFSGDNGPASSARIYQPGGLAVDSDGNVYIADTGNDRIRKVTPYHSTAAPFAFVEQPGVPLDTLVTSSTITVSGIEGAVLIAISGGEYEVNDSGLWLNTPSTVYSGDSVRARQTSSSNYLTTTNATLTVGRVSAVFSVKTIAGPSLSVAPLSLSFGNQVLKTTSEARIVTVENTGSAPLTITGISVGGVNYHQFIQTNACPATLATGASCTVSITYHPTRMPADPAMSAKLKVNVASPAVSQIVPLTGTVTPAPALTVTPSTLSYGNQAINTISVVKKVTVTNSGTAPLIITGISKGGMNPSQFSLATACPTGGTGLAAGASCTISVKFKPTTAGAKSASLAINVESPAESKTVTLTGTGLAPVATVSPASLSYSDQAINTISAPKAVTVSNTGNQPLVITGISKGGTNAGQFSQTNTCPMGGTGLAAGSSCTIKVKFKPTTVGTKSASLAINVEGPAISKTVMLSGAAIP